jgi:hypothetical protein
MGGIGIAIEFGWLPVVRMVTAIAAASGAMAIAMAAIAFIVKGMVSMATALVAVSAIVTAMAPAMVATTAAVAAATKTVKYPHIQAVYLPVSSRQPHLPGYYYLLCSFPLLIAIMRS